MNLLDEQAASVPAHGWSLEELVAAANATLHSASLLPAVEDRPGSAGKVREEVNARLVRHYAGSGLLDENSREGRGSTLRVSPSSSAFAGSSAASPKAYPAAVIAKLILGKDDAELRALLQGGASVNATPANPALDFLAGVRRRAVSPPAAVPSPPSACTRLPAGQRASRHGPGRKLGPFGTPARSGGPRPHGFPLALQSARARAPEPVLPRCPASFEPPLPLHPNAAAPTNHEKDTRYRHLRCPVDPPELASQPSGLAPGRTDGTRPAHACPYAGTARRRECGPRAPAAQPRPGPRPFRFPWEGRRWSTPGRPPRSPSISSGPRTA